MVKEVAQHSGNGSSSCSALAAKYLVEVECCAGGSAKKILLLAQLLLLRRYTRQVVHVGSEIPLGNSLVHLLQLLCEFALLWY